MTFPITKSQFKIPYLTTEEENLHFVENLKKLGITFNESKNIGNNLKGFVVYATDWELDATLQSDEYRHGHAWFRTKKNVIDRKYWTDEQLKAIEDFSKGYEKLTSKEEKDAYCNEWFGNFIDSLKGKCKELNVVPVLGRAIWETDEQYQTRLSGENGESGNQSQK